MDYLITQGVEQRVIGVLSVAPEFEDVPANVGGGQAIVLDGQRYSGNLATVAVTPGTYDPANGPQRCWPV